MVAHARCGSQVGLKVGLGLLVAVLVPTAWSLRDEWTVAQALAARDRQDAGQWIDIDAIGDRGHGLPPRAAMVDALVLGRAVAPIAGKRRASILARAEGLIGKALVARPYWGEASVTAAYLAVLARGAEDERARAAFARSYRDAPYLIDSAVWRIRYGLSLWWSLDADMRGHVVREAVWYGGLGADRNDTVTKLIGGTSAESLYTAELRRARAESWRP